MLQDDIRKRLALLITGQDQPVEVSDQRFHLKETGAGEADLEIQLSNECILFRKLEKRKLQYFQNQKCADYVLFEYRDPEWCVHIFELKKTVGTEKWKEIKQQFSGALQNALALAGVLGIDIDLYQTALYTVYRNDRINDTANPGKLRFQMSAGSHHNTQSNEKTDWNAENITIQLIENMRLSHHKVALDIADGTGSYWLKQELSRSKMQTTT